MNKKAFAHIQNWVFDLDNTLYPPERDLFALVDVRMTDFIKKTLAINHDQAATIQKKYWMDYGTTLRGLMVKHDIKPDVFLDFVHDIDVSELNPDPELDKVLSELEGPKFIFSNGTTLHAENVANQLGILHHFDDVFDIRAGDYVPKPQADVYDKMLAKFSIDPKRSVFFEDIARNLAPAANLGMTTVWLRPPLDKNTPPHNKISYAGTYEGTEEDYIDHIIDALVPFLKTLV